jgi:exosortase/archaeosortase family protein
LTPGTGSGRYRQRLLRFCAIFVALQLVVQAVYYGWLLKSGIFRDYLHFLGASAAALVRWTGHPVVCDGDTMRGAFEMSIRSGCDGLQAMAILGTAVFAFPSSWPRRLAGASVGVLALVGVNILRIATLFLAGESWPRQFQTLHVHVWPALLMLCTIVLWVFWASRVAPAPKTA